MSGGDTTNPPKTSSRSREGAGSRFQRAVIGGGVAGGADGGGAADGDAADGDADGADGGGSADGDAGVGLGGSSRSNPAPVFQ